jgi:hypothetical protein
MALQKRKIVIFRKSKKSESSCRLGKIIQPVYEIVA